MITTINKNQYFRFIYKMMYAVYNKDHIHNLTDEYKMLIFTCNSDQIMHVLYLKNNL